MARKEQKSDGHGSLKQLQLLVNEKPQIINELFVDSLPELADDEIIWHSPLTSDNYAEYTDDDFIKKVGLDPEEINLKEFWPRRGANWDGLATTDYSKIILIEAKANILELVSGPSGAGEKSMSLIQKSLNATKKHLNISNQVNWTGKFYQYTNRIAHLYFLRVKKKKDVYLVNVYFIGDESVDGPKTKDEWKGAIKVMKYYLGLSNHKLQKYMADVFVDVNELIKEI